MPRLSVPNVTALAALTVALAAQEPRPAVSGDGVVAGAQQTADFDNLIRIDTRLVEVDVVVRDAQGPVKGLTEADFTVYDNGKRVPIASFSLREGRISTRPRTPLPRGAVSNRLNNRGEEPAEATVILWDVLNTEMQDQAWVQSQVVRYLQTLGQDDRVALYRLVKTLAILQDFTGDPERLRNAVQTMRPEQSVNLQAATLTDQAGTIKPLAPYEPGSEEAAEYEELIDQMNKSQLSAALEFEWFNTRDRALITLTSLRSIARHLHGIPGRKKLIWISGSFPAFQQQENSRLGATQIESLNLGLQIQKAIEDLNESNVAVYPVDPRGLTTGFSSMAQTIDYAKTRGGFTVTGIDTMNLLAGGTGGRAFYAGNDVASAMARVFEDYDVTYTLGFRPSKEKVESSYHNIAVRVNRRGVEVRHRRGYFDDEARVADERLRQGNMSLAMRNELDSTGVGLVAQSQPVDAAAGQYRVTLSIDANDLAFRNMQGRWVAMVDYATYFSQTPTMTGTTEAVLINLGEERYREVLRDGVHVSRIVETGGPTGRLRIAIQDRTTGKIGSVWVRLGD